MQAEKLIFISNHAALKRGTVEDDLVEMEIVALADAASQAELAAMRAREQQQQAGPSTAIDAAEDDTHSVETLDVSELLQEQEAASNEQMQGGDAVSPFSDPGEGKLSEMLLNMPDDGYYE